MSGGRCQVSGVTCQIYINNVFLQSGWASCSRVYCLMLLSEILAARKK